MPKEMESLSLRELNGQLSKARALMDLYEKHANSNIRSEAELEQVQREIIIIKNEILSELAHSKKSLQARLQALQQVMRQKELGPRG